MATDHGYSEFISTPQRHPLAGGAGSDWTIHESKYSDNGVRLIWSCEISAASAKPKPKPASKKKPAKKTQPKKPETKAPASKPAAAPVALVKPKPAPLTKKPVPEP